MAKSYMRRMHSFNRFILVLFVCLSLRPIYSEENLEIKETISSQYPDIKIVCKARNYSPDKSEEILLSEGVGPEKKIISKFQILEHKNPDPLEVYLSLPSYQNWEEKKWLLSFAHNIALVLERSKGQFFLNIQSDEKFILYEGIPSQKINPSFSLPKEEPSKQPIRSWEKLLSRVESNGNKNQVFIVVSFHTDWEDKFKISDFARKVQDKKISFLVLGPNELETTKLASYANGTFFSISSKEGIANLFKELSVLSLPLLDIHYQSQLGFSKWSDAAVKGEIVWQDGKVFEYSYQLSWWRALYELMIDPFVFFPILFFFIILCFSILYYLRGFDPITSVAESPSTQTINREKRAKEFRSPQREQERTIYEQVYGEVSEKAKENEMVQQILEKEELMGNEYHVAFLVLKEGNHSGERFQVQKEEIFLGRNDTNDIVVNDPYVEGKHAKIRRIRGRLVLFDCASEEGVFLNGRKLLRPKPLHDLDEIRIGKTNLVFRAR